MKRLTAFLLPFILCTVTAWSAEKNLQTMYLKTQSYAYLCPSANDEYAAAVYGKGEAVQPAGWQNGYCVINHLGQELYLPGTMVTAEKPRWSYSVRNTHRKLTLRKNCILYSQPSKSAEKMVCADQQMYTVGETKRWYKLYTEGKVVFIRKDSRDILKNSAAAFPEIILSCPGGTENLRERIKYFYCLIPQAAREMTGTNLKIYVTQSFSRADFEQMGAGAYACSDGRIYLKENPAAGFSGMTEQCFLHEIGHMVQYACRSSPGDILEAAADLMEKDLMGRDPLQLREYYLSEGEYLAETFEIYVKNPEKLKNSAPETWNYFFRLFH